MNPVAAVATLSVPDWATLPWLVHGFSTRAGGRTTVYQTRREEGQRTGSGDLNLGFTPEDERETVSENRRLLLDHLLGPGRAASACLVTLRQTHSATVHRVDGAPAVGLEGDGLMSDTPGVLLGILTADCVPVLVLDPVRRAVAALHAGWRGTAQQIVERGVHRMQQEFGSRPEELLAAIGPAIGPCCYTVGEEVRDAFAARLAYAGELFAEVERPAPDPGALANKPVRALRLDLAEANCRQLLRAGLAATHVTRIGGCTGCGTGSFFSHRAEHGSTGRMMALIGVRSQ